MNRTFTDKYNHKDYSGYEVGKANEDFTKFYNKYPFIKLIFVEKRPRYVENAGNGTGYYDIDVIFLVDERYCEKDNSGDYRLKGER